MRETVLVTGGSGFIGGWCIIELLRRGYSVRSTVRSKAREPEVRAAIATEVDAGELSFFIADLVDDRGWDEAVAGCDFVLHVASPLGVEEPRDPNALIVPARDGTLRVLRAATRAGVKRVVMTGSTSAASRSLSLGASESDETIWSDLSAPETNAYRRAKTLAERAAWDFIAQAGGATTLTTVLPCAVLGPVLSAHNLGSVQLVERLLNGSVPAIPRFGLNLVDVRDVADAHLRAMTNPAAAGERFIVAHDFMWMSEIARTLKQSLGERARGVPTRELPDFLLRLAAPFVPVLRNLTPTLSRKFTCSSEKAKRVLGWSPRPVSTTVVDCAERLLSYKSGP